MRRVLSVLVVLSLCSPVLVGCSDKATTKKETSVSTPGGTTTKTETKEMKTSGENPPAAPEAGK